MSEANERWTPCPEPTTALAVDVAVARYKMFSKVAEVVISALVATIGVVAADTMRSTIDLENATVVIAPGGSVTVAPVEASAYAGMLSPLPVRSC